MVKDHEGHNKARPIEPPVSPGATRLLVVKYWVILYLQKLKTENYSHKIDFF